MANYESEIILRVGLDEQKMPEHIRWEAAHADIDGVQEAKALLLSLWDGDEKGALRFDLWTQSMRVDEMNDFFYQTLMGLADTYQRATQNESLAKELRTFALDFGRKAADALRASQEQAP